MVEMFVLQTTATYPDAIQSLYKTYKRYATIFVAFLIIQLLLFNNIFLAVVINVYSKICQTQVKQKLKS